MGKLSDIKHLKRMEMDEEMRKDLERAFENSRKTAEKCIERNKRSREELIKDKTEY